jgi:hypothetical protein
MALPTPASSSARGVNAYSRRVKALEPMRSAMMSVVIRRAEKSDLAPVLDLYAQDELSTSPRPTDLAPIVEAFEAIASDPGAFLYVATEDGRVVGTFQVNILGFERTHEGMKLTL